MEFHPAADAFPLMDAQRFDELRADIEAHGLREEITLCDGMILDGRNRYRACIELGIEPRFREHDGDPWAFAWSLNGMRRDLVAEQRYLIWKFCHEQSEDWQAEKRRIQEEANRKRSAATKEQPRNEDGTMAEKPVAQQSVAGPVDEHPTATTKATASKTNTGAVQRGDIWMRVSAQ